MRKGLVANGGSGGINASSHPVNGCLLTLAILSVMITLVTMLHGYLFCLPFSQFDYPLELDFRRLITELESQQSLVSSTSPVGVDWVKPINNKQFPVLHKNSGRCASFNRQSGAAGSSYKLLVLIKSALPNYRFRQALRATWAVDTSADQPDSNGVPTVQIRHAFVLGGTRNTTAKAQIDREQQIYGDIIQQGFIDAYFNNTYKLMFAIDWAASHCPGADFVLFADDDYYVSRQNLAALLVNLITDGFNSYSSLVTGHVFSAPLPKRNLFNKWYTSLAEYPYTFWPPYPTGGAFLVSNKLCRQLSLAQRYVRYLRFDDVFLGILLWKLGVKPMHNQQFYLGDLPTPITRAAYKNLVAVHLDKDLSALAKIWQAMSYPSAPTAVGGLVQ